MLIAQSDLKRCFTDQNEIDRQNNGIVRQMNMKNCIDRHSNAKSSVADSLVDLFSVVR